MALHVRQNQYVIPNEQRNRVSLRYKTITKAINGALWNSASDLVHSFYVGSYGRGTAIDTSDIDILMEVPQSFYVPNSYTSYNPQSRLLQVVKNAIQRVYPQSDIRADGQVVVIDFSDGIKFEVLPAIPKKDYWGRTTYEYPDSHKGGRWKSTNPKAEQEAMKTKNNLSNGLLFDTCQHMRYIRDTVYSSNHLSGIIIDSFVNVAMGAWHWQSMSGGISEGEYEAALQSFFNDKSFYGNFDFSLQAPGSGDPVSTYGSLDCLKKVIAKMTE